MKLKNFGIIYNNNTEPDGFPAILNLIKMKKIIQYTTEMNQADPAGIPTTIGITILFYVVYFILIPLFQ